MGKQDRGGEFARRELSVKEKERGNTKASRNATGQSMHY